MRLFIKFRYLLFKACYKFKPEINVMNKNASVVESNALWTV